MSSNYPTITINEFLNYNVQDPASELPITELSGGQNMNSDRLAITKIKGYSNFGTDQGSKVVGLAEYKSSTGVIPMMVSGQALKKYITGAWTNTDKTALTSGLEASMVTFNAAIGSALVTGTATSGANRSLTDTSKTWTVDQYLGKIIKITAGTGVGQAKLITGNDVNIIYINGLWDFNPDATSQYGIYDVAPQLYFTNGTDYVFKYNGTSSTDFTAFPKFTDIEVHKGRLLGIKGTYLYFSELGCGDYIGRNNFTQIEPDGFDANAVKSTGEFAVIYTKRKIYTFAGGSDEDPQNFILVKRNSDFGCIAPKSVASDAIRQFFLSERGVEIFNPNTLETTPYPISRKYIQPDLDTFTTAEKENASGLIWDKRYFLAIKNKIFPYDFSENIWQTPIVLPFEVNRLALIDGLPYAGNYSNGQVVKLFDTNSFAGTDITWSIETADLSVSNGGWAQVEKIIILMQKAVTTQLVSFYYSRDGTAYTLIGNVDISTIPNDMIELGLAGIGGQCRNIRLKITGTDSLPARDIKKIQFLAIPITNA